LAIGRSRWLTNQFVLQTNGCEAAVDSRTKSRSYFWDTSTGEPMHRFTYLITAPIIQLIKSEFELYVAVQ